MWSPPDNVAEFKIIKPIGAGAMGRVFLAQDTLLGRTVAIKFVGAVEVSDHARERFYREARAIARLSHPNVVVIHRVGELRQRPYLVSEFIDGDSLDKLPKPLPWTRVVAIGIDAARGLAAAHRRDVLHRDIKPANIIVGLDDSAKLLDFGLAHIVGDEPATKAPPSRRELDPAATTSNDGRLARPLAAAEVPPEQALIGTPLYLAPEMWTGEPATAASDIYSFGIVLYELLAGRAPGAGLSLDALREAVVSRSAPALRDLATDAPGALVSLITACLSRDPAQRPASASALLEHLELLRAPLRTESPYRGLLAFQPEQRSLFFGRDHDIASILERLRHQAFVVVAGDSGTGKSSLCRAGVLPAFVDQEGSRWRVRMLSPGTHPLKALEDLALDDQPTIVFIDQLEELVTLSAPDQREEMAARLVGLASDPTRRRVLGTARSDFLGRLAELDHLGNVLSKSLVLIGPLTERGLREAVTAPARLAGYQLAPGLVDELVASGRRSLPLLQFALHELWDGRDDASKSISLGALAAIGGVGGALARHADRVMAEFDERDHDCAWRMLLRLVTADGTRASVALDALVDVAASRADGERVVERLVQARLVVVQPDAERRVEVAHEALFSKWPRLVEWRRAHDHDARFRDRLAEAAAHWRERGRPRGLLWRGDALGEYRAWRARWREPVGTFEREFGHASEADARRARRLLVVAIATVVIGLTLGIVLLYRADRRTEAQRLALIADQAAREHAAGFNERALPYLLHLQREGIDTAAVRIAIEDSTRDLRRATGSVVKVPRGAVGVQWAPDGSWFVVIERSGGVHIADRRGVVMRTWEVGREVSKPAISADNRVAATDRDGSVWMWSLDQPTPTTLMARPRSHDPNLGIVRNAPAFDPSGRYVASAGPDGIARLWSIATGELWELGEPGSSGVDVLVTAELVVTCGADGRVGAWRLRDRGRVIDARLEDRRVDCRLGAMSNGALVAVTGTKIVVWDEPGAPPREQTSGPDHPWYLGNVVGGRLVVHGSGLVELLEVSTLRKLGRFSNNRGVNLSSARLSKDGARLVTSGDDGFFRVWNVERQSEQFALDSAPFAGTTSNAPQGALDAMVSPDNTTLLTMSGVDVRLWKLDDAPVLDKAACACEGVLSVRWTRDQTAMAIGGNNLAAVVSKQGVAMVSPPPGRGWDVTWSGDGTRALFVGTDGYAKVAARDGSVIRDLPGHRGNVNHAATSPDGRSFATACSDHFVRIFDVDTGELLRIFSAGAPAVSVAWSPDGRRVAGAGYDGSIPIWDVESGQLEQRLFDPSTQFLDISWSPDGDRLATAGHDNVVRVWTIADGAYRELLGHQGPVTGVAWNSNGDLLASSAESGGIRIWDPDSGREVARRDLRIAFESVDWHPAGDRLLVAGHGHGALVLDAKHDRVPLETLEQLVQAGPWELAEGQLVRKQTH